MHSDSDVKEIWAAFCRMKHYGKVSFILPFQENLLQVGCFVNVALVLHKGLLVMVRDFLNRTDPGTQVYFLNQNHMNNFISESRLSFVDFEKRSTGACSGYQIINILICFFCFNITLDLQSGLCRRFGIYHIPRKLLYNFETWSFWKVIFSIVSYVCREETYKKKNIRGTKLWGAYPCNGRCVLMR